MTVDVLDDRVGADREWIRRKGLRAFVQEAWRQVEPAPLIWGWHLDAVCEHLEAVTRDEIDALVINEPPGCSKSLVVSVLWPAWVWTLDPTYRWICASYDKDVVLRDARKSRTMIEGDWFRARWPGVRLPSDASASKAVSSFYNTRGGMRFSTTVRGSVTGQHGDCHLIDDPHDPHGVASAAELDATLAWWRETMPSRFRNPKRRRRVLVMQRLHERDLSAEMIRAGATVLCLPMRYERAHPHRWARDPRTREGELLVPERYDETAVIELATDLGPTAADAQLQQRTAPAGGVIFKEAWLRHYWTVLPPGGTFTQSWDCAFKAKSDSDFVCGQVWYQLGARFYLVDQVLDRLSFNETLDAIRALTKRYPQARRKLIEDKANGPAIIDTLKHEIPGVVEYSPGSDGKEARARAVEPFFAAGNVLLPHPERAEYEDGRRGALWVRGGAPLDAEAARGSYEWFMLKFPKAGHDDCVDATTQFLNSAGGSFAQRMRAAVDKAAPRAST